MAKNHTDKNFQKAINDLKLYRSGWANDIREGWVNHMKGSQEILFSLYEISGCIILALENDIAGHFHDKMPLILVQRKLEKLVTSPDFQYFNEMGKEGMCGVVTNATKHHIRVMLKMLEILTD